MFSMEQLVEEAFRRDPTGMSLFRAVSSRFMQLGENPVQTSLEAVLHARGRSSTPCVKKRKVIPMVGQVITDEECRIKLGEMEKEKNKPKKKVTQVKNPKKKLPPKKTEVIEEDSDSTSVSSVLMTDANTSSDLSVQDIIQDDIMQDDIMQGDIIQDDEGKASEGTTAKPTLCAVDDADVGKYVAVYFSNPKPQYYWGKVIKTFSTDEDTDVTQVEIDFLKKKTISSNPSDWTWTDQKVKEIIVVDTKFLIYGPVIPDIRKNIFIFPDVQATASFHKFEGM